MRCQDTMNVLDLPVHFCSLLNFECFHLNACFVHHIHKHVGSVLIFLPPTQHPSIKANCLFKMFIRKVQINVCSTKMMRIQVLSLHNI